MSATPLDVALSSLAKRQHGVVTAAQIRSCGLGDSAIGHRAEAGRLHRLHRGVYAVGHASLSLHGHCMAAALAVGPEAVVSHRSAAVLWGLLESRPDRAEVSVARNARSRPGIRVHVVRRLDHRDRTTTAGIPITRPSRTLLDLADVVTPTTLRRATREAFVQRLVTERSLRDVLARAAGRRGASRLKGLIEPAPRATRSELEDRFLDLIEAHGLKRPAVNAPVTDVPNPIVADFLFAAARLVVETDGARYHDHRLARESDAARQAMLEAAGYSVLRLTWAQVTRRGDETVRRVRNALAHAERSAC